MDNGPASLPDGVAAFDYVSFSELFPRAAAIVHAGGVGTTALAMRAGRPMLVMPCTHDQFDSAARGRPDSASRARFLDAGTIRPVSRPSCGICSTFLNTPSGHRESESGYGKRTGCGPLVTPWKNCSDPTLFGDPQETTDFPPHSGELADGRDGILTR